MVWLKCQQPDPCGNKFDIETASSNLITNKVKINLDMLRASMEDRIGSEVGGADIVTPKCWWRLKKQAKFLKERLQPCQLSSGIGECTILSLRA